MGKNTNNSIFTIPNILSFFRIAIIPLFVYQYYFSDNPLAGCAILIISGMTDVLDGCIARRFNMVSDLGKILDPVADKLTQAVVLLCLAEKYRMMMLPLFILLVKECVGAVLCVLTIRKSGLVQSSNWHGKLNTVVLYAVFAIHLIWPDIPQYFSLLTIYLSCLIMLLSFALYSASNFTELIKSRKLR